MYRTVITSILLFSMCIHIFPFVALAEARTTSTITTHLHVPLTAHTTVRAESKQDPETASLKPETSLLVKDYLSSTRAVVNHQQSIISYFYYHQSAEDNGREPVGECGSSVSC